MAQILLIDDMKGVRRAIGASLGRAGHVVTEANDGEMGIELLKNGHHFDLVITDMMMPKSDGTEVIVFLETQLKRPKCLAISGGGSQVSTAEAFMLAHSKADAVLAKPFDTAELITVVDRLLGNSASVSHQSLVPGRGS